MVELTKENFETEVTNYEGVAFVDFWGPKCVPCMALMPDVEAFAEKNAGRAKFCKLNTEGQKRLAMTQKVMGIPAFLFYKNGEKVFSFVKDVETDTIDMAAVQSKLDELLA